MNPNRQPSGAPNAAGGQFAPGARDDADTALPDETAAVALSELGLRPGEAEHVDRYELQSEVFEHADITLEDDGTYTVQAAVSLGPSEGLADLIPTEANAESWLDERQSAIQAWLADEYDAQDMSGEDWDWQEVSFTVDGLPATTGTDEITSILESRTKAVALYNESDPGTYGVRNMWRQLGEHLTELDAQADDAAWAYVNAALWTEEQDLPDRGEAEYEVTYDIRTGIDGSVVGSESTTVKASSPDQARDRARAWVEDNDPQFDVRIDPRIDVGSVDHISGEESWLPEDIGAAPRAQLVHEVRDFLVANRRLLGQAREIKADYDAAQAGHDLWLTRNHLGVGFWDRGLGEVGDQLTERAHAKGERSLIVSDTGDLAFE